jgi:hypothetical protein
LTPVSMAAMWDGFNFDRDAHFKLRCPIPVSAGYEVRR